MLEGSSVDRETYQKEQALLETLKIITQAQNAARKAMFSGFLWAAAGTLISYLSYQSANAGDVYYILWGAVVYGLIRFARGFFLWLKVG
ncbi:MAG: hypothetical protein C4551_02460 [Bacillota bacterium]|nr:MAG: hypothetical protein C4551_02460 [Bacillota bacterium]